MEFKRNPYPKQRPTVRSPDPDAFATTAEWLVAEEKANEEYTAAFAEWRAGMLAHAHAEDQRQAQFAREQQEEQARRDAEEKARLEEEARKAKEEEDRRKAQEDEDRRKAQEEEDRRKAQEEEDRRKAVEREAREREDADALEAEQEKLRQAALDAPRNAGDLAGPAMVEDEDEDLPETDEAADLAKRKRGASATEGHPGTPAPPKKVQVVPLRSASIESTDGPSISARPPLARQLVRRVGVASATTAPPVASGSTQERASQDEPLRGLAALVNWLEQQPDVDDLAQACLEEVRAGEVNLRQRWATTADAALFRLSNAFVWKHVEEVRAAAAVATGALVDARQSVHDSVTPLFERAKSRAEAGVRKRSTLATDGGTLASELANAADVPNVEDGDVDEDDEMKG